MEPSGLQRERLISHPPRAKLTLKTLYPPAHPISMLPRRVWAIISSTCNIEIGGGGFGPNPKNYMNSDVAEPPNNSANSQSSRKSTNCKISEKLQKAPINPNTFFKVNFARGWRTTTTTTTACSIKSHCNDVIANVIAIQRIRES